MSTLSDPLHALPTAPTAPTSATAATARPTGRSAPVPAAAALLMALSGFAGLGYQIVWTQQLGAWLGHEIVAVLAMVAAFFGGLALGALALGRRIAASERPAHWYAALEAVIGLWALALTPLLPSAGAALADLTGAQPAAWWQWSVAFAGPFALLLPATAAMGATLPAMDRLTERLRGEGRAIGGLYAANTLGAVAGVLASAFALVPWLGLSGSALVCASFSLLCAAGTLVVLSPGPGRPDAGREQEPADSVRWRAWPQAAAWPGRLAALWRTSRPARPLTAWAPEPGLRLPLPQAHRVARGARPLAALGLTGLLGIGYEVVVVRVLSQVTENTVYTFALLLAVYLLGTAAGAAGYQRWGTRSTAPARLSGRLLCALAASCLMGTLTLWASAGVQQGAQQLLGRGFGPGFAAAISAEAAMALAAFALPTAAMGALFSHLCTQARAAGWSLGAAVAANTLGAALAPLAFGVLLLPALGAKLALVLIALGYLALLTAPAWRRPAAWLPAAGAVAVAGIGGPLAFVDLPEGARLLSHRDGVMAAVSVVEDAQGASSLHINNRQQEGSSATWLSDARQAWLPLLLHPAPDTALFLGLGTGTTAAAAALEAQLQVDAVELLPEVIAAAAHFVPALAPDAAAPLPNLRVLSGDARRHVRTSPRRYDVIVADLFHPARSGAGALYTVEHFAAVGSRLAPQGLFCQWLPLHQLDLNTLRSIVRAFTTVFPGATAVLATHSLDTPVLGLVARPGSPGMDRRPLRARSASMARQPRLDALKLDDEFAVLGSFVAGPASLSRFGASAPLNTDDRPIVNYRAPRVAYAPQARPRERLVALLRELAVEPGELLAAPADRHEQGWHQRLAAYWAVRDRFIEVGAGVQPSPDLHAMLDQVREPLLDLLHRSPDFRAAYDPLLQMALALARTEPEAARVLLGRLQRAQPARSEAGQALRRLAEAPPGARR